jgi:hypothetical protein
MDEMTPSQPEIKLIALVGNCSPQTPVLPEKCVGDDDGRDSDANQHN